MTDAPPGSVARFEFGANWRRFIDHVDADRIAIAEDAIRSATQMEHLEGRTFLDVGCGSGLFSLAAHRLGALVRSFDFDPASVEAAQEIQARFAVAGAWPIERGSVLDESFMSGLGEFDIVYSFGVLHHTGAMWRAIDLALDRVAGGGRAYLALYNDQGRVSTMWRAIKRVYNRLPGSLRPVYVAAMSAPRELGSFALALAAREPGRYVRGWTHYRSARGMSRWHDMVDWVGGLPFEVAQPGDVVNHAVDRGFRCIHLTTVGRRLGCNEYLLERGV